MAIKQMVIGATRKSAPPSAVEQVIKKWVWKNALTAERHKEDVDHHFMTLEEWRDFHWEKVVQTSSKRCVINLNRFIDWALIDRHDDPEERNEKLTAWANKLVEPLGWYVGGMSGTKTIILDPLQMPQVLGLAKLYHFSPFFNKDKILRKGLIPKGTTDSRGFPKYGDDYKYPARTHLLTRFDEDEIRELAYHIFNYGEGIEQMYHGGAHMHMPLVVFEIDASKCRPGTKFYEDVSVKNGVFTYTHIPPQALKIKLEDETPEDYTE